jgi:hypothetical protein
MAITRATFLPSVLGAAGVPYVEHAGWKTRGVGNYLDLHSVVWHHDASGAGYSPGMADYEVREAEANRPAGGVWVALDGTWHLIAAGYTYHAGNVLAGKPDNRHGLGVETDHTTNETWSGVNQLESLRRGTAAILKYLGQDVYNFEFHKTICSPVGRKQDPWGLDISTERAAVNNILHPPVTPVLEDEVFEYKVVTIPPTETLGGPPFVTRQLVSKDVNGKLLGTFSNDVTVSIKANDNGVPVPATVQPLSYMGLLVLSFIGLDGKPLPAGGNVGVVLSHPKR